MIVVDLISKTPLYEQIKNSIISLAVKGVLAPHSQLPSIRSLSYDLKLNVNTVKHAYSELENTGIIYTLQGRGSYIAEADIVSRYMKSKALNEISAAIEIGMANGITTEEIFELISDIYSKEL